MKIRDLIARHFDINDLEIIITLKSHLDKI